MTLSSGSTSLIHMHAIELVHGIPVKSYFLQEHVCSLRSTTNFSMPFNTSNKDKSINQVHSTINPYYMFLWKHHLNIISPYFYFRKTQDEYLILHRFNQSKECLFKILYLPMHHLFTFNFLCY